MSRKVADVTTYIFPIFVDGKPSPDELEKGHEGLKTFINQGYEIVSASPAIADNHVSWAVLLVRYA